MKMTHLIPLLGEGYVDGMSLEESDASSRLKRTGIHELEALDKSTLLLQSTLKLLTVERGGHRAFEEKIVECVKTEVVLKYCRDHVAWPGVEIKVYCWYADTSDEKLCPRGSRLRNEVVEVVYDEHRFNLGA